ncbi:flagellar hook length control protein FliK [Kosakonia oryzae]|uniref:Flagellar hook-length control protein FliK n=1 Tax=Kosakonia oryzae TaxID=497725 RepID=A0AA94KQX5_9ENTR|nr:flagellar hook length control protein FliK [Kosakonia oryzae]ANI82447.1 flagellar hook length control protein FliK [Kosakonia oryzae]SFC58447.1 flagellar hook-length control protein FliK [Kosakonia oryzae]
MITLPKLVVTESDTGTSAQTGKAGGDSAQDFLALLTGAMSGTQGQTQENGEPLTLADLQAALASGKLTKGNLTAATGEEAQTPAQKLADLLARQIAKRDVTAAATESTATTADMQKLLSGLTPTAKSDVLAALNKTAQSGDEKSDATDGELAGLSALMAMLPHQQTAQLSASATTKSTGVSTQDVAAAANRALNSSSLSTAADTDISRGAAKNDPAANTPFQVADNSQQAAVLAAASATKKDNDNALQTANTTVSVAPVTTSASAAQASLPVAAPVISAPLGSHEWQQNLSQHVTLFTRQGQQTAELRLHPEDLGQVQISIKLEDNQAQLQMVSAHSHVRQALEAALPTLRTSLAESGIQLGQSSISSESFTGQQQQQASQQQHASRSGSGDVFGSDDDTAIVTPASLQSVARGNGAVDIFA